MQADHLDRRAKLRALVRQVLADLERLGVPRHVVRAQIERANHEDRTEVLLELWEQAKKRERLEIQSLMGAPGSSKA